MNQSKPLASFAAVCLALAVAGSAADAASNKKTDQAAAEDDRPAGVDKKRFETYLKERVTKISGHHKARMDFFAKEADTWNSFWTKVRDERKLFEIRTTRQTMDLFESLASLDARDHPATIADFDKLHGNVVKSFELQQKQKMTEFFAARETRWREFAADQERERVDFLAEAASDWQKSKTSLRDPAAGEAAQPPRMH